LKSLTIDRYKNAKRVETN